MYVSGDERGRVEVQLNGAPAVGAGTGNGPATALRLPTIVGPVGLPSATPGPAAANGDTPPDRVHRAYLRPCLLLLLAEGPSHGYDLVEQVRRMGIRGANPGGIYRTLRGIEEEGLVTSWWEPSQAGPARRTYALTPAGGRVLQACIASLRDAHQLVEELLARYDAVSWKVVQP